MNRRIMGGAVFTTEETKRLQRKQFFLPETQIRALERIARARGVSVAEVLRQAVREFLEREKKK